MDEPQDLAGLFLNKKKKKPTSSNNDADDSKAAVKKNKLSAEFGENEPETEEMIKIATKKSNHDQISESKLDYSFETKTEAELNPDFAPSATAINEQDTAFDRDHLTRRKEALERSRELAAKGQLDDRYRGLKGYQQFLMQGDTTKANAASDKNRVAGPVRAAANLRVTCRFDYKPDLCKDYNETGFCGFGDSCIFLHDRTEHKSSYQLDQEWEAAQKRKELDAENAEALVKSAPADDLKPAACAVCRKAFTRPVKTKCNHYFCEACVLKLKKCPTCTALLLGSFKPASKELGLLVQK